MTKLERVAYDEALRLCALAQKRSKRDSRTIARLTKELEGEREKAKALSAELASAQAKIIFPEQAMPVEKCDWHRASADTAFARPFGTIRQCRYCGCLVAGGPNACVRCVKEEAK